MRVDAVTVFPQPLNGKWIVICFVPQLPPPSFTHSSSVPEKPKTNSQHQFSSSSSSSPSPISSSTATTPSALTSRDTTPSALYHQHRSRVAPDPLSSSAADQQHSHHHPLFPPPTSTMTVAPNLNTTESEMMMTFSSKSQQQLMNRQQQQQQQQQSSTTTTTTMMMMVSNVSCPSSPNSASASAGSPSVLITTKREAVEKIQDTNLNQCDAEKNPFDLRCENPLKRALEKISIPSTQKEGDDDLVLSLSSNLAVNSSQTRTTSHQQHQNASHSQHDATAAATTSTRRSISTSCGGSIRSTSIGTDTRTDNNYHDSSSRKEQQYQTIFIRTPLTSNLKYTSSTSSSSPKEAIPSGFSIVSTYHHKDKDESVDDDDNKLVISPSVWWIGGGVEYHRCGNKGSDSSGGEDSFSALEATNLAFRFSLFSSSSADVRSFIQTPTQIVTLPRPSLFASCVGLHSSVLMWGGMKITFSTNNTRSIPSASSNGTEHEGKSKSNVINSASASSSKNTKASTTSSAASPTHSSSSSSSSETVTYTNRAWIIPALAMNSSLSSSSPFRLSEDLPLICPVTQIGSIPSPRAGAATCHNDNNNNKNNRNTASSTIILHGGMNSQRELLDDMYVGKIVVLPHGQQTTNRFETKQENTDEDNDEFEDKPEAVANTINVANDDNLPTTTYSLHQQQRLMNNEHHEVPDSARSYLTTTSTTSTTATTTTTNNDAKKSTTKMTMENYASKQVRSAQISNQKHKTLTNLHRSSSSSTACFGKQIVIQWVKIDLHHHQSLLPKKMFCHSLFSHVEEEILFLVHDDPSTSKSSSRTVSTIKPRTELGRQIIFGGGDFDDDFIDPLILERSLINEKGIQVDIVEEMATEERQQQMKKKRTKRKQKSSQSSLTAGVFEITPRRSTFGVGEEDTSNDKRNRFFNWKRNDGLVHLPTNSIFHEYYILLSTEHLELSARKFRLPTTTTSIMPKTHPMMTNHENSDKINPSRSPSPLSSSSSCSPLPTLFVTEPNQNNVHHHDHRTSSEPMIQLMHDNHKAEILRNGNDVTVQVSIVDHVYDDIEKQIDSLSVKIPAPWSVSEDSVLSLWCETVKRTVLERLLGSVREEVVHHFLEDSFFVVSLCKDPVLFAPLTITTLKTFCRESLSFDDQEDETESDSDDEEDQRGLLQRHDKNKKNELAPLNIQIRCHANIQKITPSYGFLGGGACGFVSKSRIIDEPYHQQHLMMKQPSISSISKYQNLRSACYREIACKTAIGPNKSETAAQLQREAAVMRQLRHPCLVRYYGLHSSSGKEDVLLMEACGRDVLTVIQSSASISTTTRNFYTLSQIRKILRCVASALEFLHALNCASLDLKPQNILFSSPSASLATLEKEFDEEENPYPVKLADFGFSFFPTEIVNAAMVMNSSNSSSGGVLKTTNSSHHQQQQQQKTGATDAFLSPEAKKLLLLHLAQVPLRKFSTTSASSPTPPSGASPTPFPHHHHHNNASYSSSSTSRPNTAMTNKNSSTSTTPIPPQYAGLFFPPTPTLRHHYHQNTTSTHSTQTHAIGVGSNNNNNNNNATSVLLDTPPQHGVTSSSSLSSAHHHHHHHHHNQHQQMSPFVMMDTPFPKMGTTSSHNHGVNSSSTNPKLSSPPLNPPAAVVPLASTLQQSSNTTTNAEPTASPSSIPPPPQTKQVNKLLSSSSPIPRTTAELSATSDNSKSKSPSQEPSSHHDETENQNNNNTSSETIMTTMINAAQKQDIFAFGVTALCLLTSSATNLPQRNRETEGFDKSTLKDFVGMHQLDYVRQQSEDAHSIEGKSGEWRRFLEMIEACLEFDVEKRPSAIEILNMEFFGL